MDSQTVIGRIPSEQVALACLVAIVGGLLATKAAHQSMDRAVLVLLMTCIVAGLVLGGRERRLLDSVLSSSFAVAVLFALTTAVYFAVVEMVAAHAPPSGSAPGSLHLAGHDLVEGTLLLAGISCVGSFVMTLLTTLASRPLFSIFAQLFAAGPEAIERTNKILVALSATVAALFALWAPFG